MKDTEEFSRQSAAVKLFCRRGKKIDTGDAVSSYGEVVSVALSDVCGRIFKAEKNTPHRNPTDTIGRGQTRYHLSSVQKHPHGKELCPAL